MRHRSEINLNEGRKTRENKTTKKKSPRKSIWTKWVYHGNREQS